MRGGRQPAPETVRRLVRAAIPFAREMLAAAPTPTLRDQAERFLQCPTVKRLLEDV